MPKHLARYRICPNCSRAVPVESAERYCSNDGAPLLEACPHCSAPITSPYGHFCPICGAAYRRKRG